ncbi:exonuclease domain-containing protein [Rhodococcus opacus]|uniref:exonuclease domain-containing protein n=1 Tax=Rhodococcus opacus TaxID=37919 RepID=UPI00294937D2|nr:exonuclease domain-containing protein [Rhodococcus opacus]MDV6247232.1 exonuclease domain-containing protein [Rhodococcus opacus]
MSAPPMTTSALCFAAVDVETANDDRGSICEIGVTIVIDARIVGTRTWRCRPPTGVDTFGTRQIRTHGITADDVAEAPRFGQIWPAVAHFIGDLPLVAQNKSFDISALRRACELSAQPLPHLEAGCTMLWGRRLHRDLPNHQLRTLCTHFGVELRKHHHAGEDAHACAQILIEMNYANGTHHSLAEFAVHTGHPMDTLNNRGLPVTGLSALDAGRRIGTLTLTGTAAGILAGRSAVLVNRMNTLTRPTAATLAAKLGASITNKVTTRTDLLIVGSRPGTSADTVRLDAARLARAGGRRIDVLTELEFLKITSTL